ncbi:hypothetical protein [Mesorhizobium sp.]|uniref:hypothetical protein n=1 Tax=Mesorhizobium sp. TaxID=1871066 RepID=UPI0025D8E472|nr:hypothetical protein [Mesorhizobium sp.]
MLQNKIETRLNRKRAIGIKLASRHILSRPDQIGDKEKVADDLPLMVSLVRVRVRAGFISLAGLVGEGVGERAL